MNVNLYRDDYAGPIPALTAIIKKYPERIEENLMFSAGDRVTVLSNGSAYKGKVHKDLGDEIYLVEMKSGAIWRADGMWLKPRTVRNPGNF